MVLTIFLLGFLFMLLNELEDECIVGNWSGSLSKWNSRQSWRNKWALGPKGQLLLSGITLGYVCLKKNDSLTALRSLCS